MTRISKQPAPTRRALLAGAAAATVAATSTLLPTRVHAQAGLRNYVLVHGAWFGGWVWKAVAEKLRAMGHYVYAPTLTGLGDRQHLLKPGINLDTHAEDVLNLVRMEGLDKIVLVGWSYAGMVIPDVLSRIPDKVASMVYLDAFVPDRGMSQMDYANRNGSKAAVEQMAAEGKDLPPMSAATWISDPQAAAYVNARLGPHPVMTLLQPSKALPQRPTKDIPHSYFLAGEYAKQSPTFVTVHKKVSEDPNFKAEVLPVNHGMMWTHPALVADVLHKVR